MPSPSVLRATALVSISLLMVSSAALAGWSTEPVTISPTTAKIPLVEACSDGAHGTFVAWQEETSPGVGQLRVQHLLVSGDLDPAWPALGAVAVATAASRTELSVLPDRLGGAYLLWQDAGSLYAVRIDGNGAVAAGWPAVGRLIGSVSAANPRACIIEDGAHGFYASWSTNNLVAAAIHLGPSNSGAGGWPNTPRFLSVTGNETYWPQVAIAPDGGVFFAYATWDPNALEGSWRLRRLTTAGLTATGWTSAGISFGDFHRDYLNNSTQLALLGLAEDSRGGAFLLIADPVSSDGYSATLETRLYRRLGDGSTAADWPDAGRVDTGAPPFLMVDPLSSIPLPDASFRILSDHADGALVGSFTWGTDSPTGINFLSCDAAGQWSGQLDAFVAKGYEIASRGDGGFVLADFYPKGPYAPAEPYAYLDVDGSEPDAALLSENHSEIVVTFYGDIGLASTEDGGT